MSKVDILDAWMAWEVLTPFTFRARRDLAEGNPALISDFTNAPLPWEGNPENPPDGKSLFFHVVLGSLQMKLATERFLGAFPDKSHDFVEFSSFRGDFAMLAVVTVNSKGMPVDNSGIAVSSFGWGLSRVLAGEIDQLKNWPVKEEFLINSIGDSVRCYDEEGNLLPLTIEKIGEAFENLVQILGIPHDLIEKPDFAIKVYQWDALEGVPEPSLLNSFFIKDLKRARDQCSAGNIGEGLQRYLGKDPPENTVDLLNGRDGLRELLRPLSIPLGRWPSCHCLNVLQQAAINAASRELENPGIVGVNGPPGTGKTTLIRDFVAKVIVDRARVMVNYDDPLTAFEGAEQIQILGHPIGLSKVNSDLSGFEILIASSNNKAVENISKELPFRHRITADDLEYFKSVSDALRDEGVEEPTWGLISAVLGKTSNCTKFVNSIWQDEDTGLKQYFKKASGGAVANILEVDPETDEKKWRQPHIIEAENPPRSRTDALNRWRTAQTAFLRAVEEVTKSVEVLEKVRLNFDNISNLKSESLKLQQKCNSLSECRDGIKQQLVREGSSVASQKVVVESASDKIRSHKANRPSFVLSIFGTKKYAAWKSKDADLIEKWRVEKSRLKAKKQTYDAISRQVDDLSNQFAIAKEAMEDNRGRLDAAEMQFEFDRDRLRCHFPDADFWNKDHSTFHRSSPWFTDEDQKLRDTVFSSAIRLHKAFLDASAEAVRGNLMALFQTFRGFALQPPQANDLLPHLWTTLFMVTPVISTTFASVSRMLEKMPPDSIGWLMIDEAGQAIPQAAVGAIMRSEKTVVLGDPRQIEPVVKLPESLIAKICRTYNIDPECWGAGSSVQKLADEASLHQSIVNNVGGPVKTGIPLLVHRRCEDPMFSISNEVAYSGLMVQATSPRASLVREVLGDSHWVNINGFADGHWCEDEGKHALLLLNKLADKKIMQPDVFIISPFLRVAQKMRQMVAEADFVEGFIPDLNHWTQERIGTIHTFQGKEAEAVIVVLGAPSLLQKGARSWAGSRPNLLNVAVSRAKCGFYVIGNRNAWGNAGAFEKLDSLIGPEPGENQGVWTEFGPGST